MPKPLVYLSSRAGNRDNAGPPASHDFMTRLTVDSRAAAVIAVDHSQSVSLGDYSGLSADSAPSSVAADDGVFYARWFGYLKIMWMEWFGLNGGHIAASLKIIGKNQENKNPAGYWSGRGSRKNR